MTDLVYVLAVEVTTPEIHSIVQDMFPRLASIPYEDLCGYFVGLSGERRGTAIPPGYLKDHNVNIKTTTEPFDVKLLTNL